LEATEQIGGDGPHAADFVHFEFIVMPGNTPGAAQLSIIKAYLDLGSPDAAAIKETSETAFYPFNSQFPQKETMIHEVLSQVTLDKTQNQTPVKSLLVPDRSDVGLKWILHRG